MLNVLEIEIICRLLNIDSEIIVKEDSNDLDLVELFSNKYNLTKEALTELEDIQEFISGLIAEKIILQSGYA